ncbi:hypothetical protein HPB48_015084 [Haemaphysalis longicornis]|uniref:DUF5641 domain-containing protein n=1 Tax=Haemaphysalis longicornis TaxID=44386 RepID=A0A9J6GUN2_HAELO|nr:hypothetical protein HPB48_015084 [Haemaphysalis longicornis]
MHSITANDLRRRLNQRGQFVSQLWKRWRKEYLLLLRSPHDALPAFPSRLQVGDVVIVQYNAFM